MFSNTRPNGVSIASRDEILSCGLIIAQSTSELLKKSGLLLERCLHIGAQGTASVQSFYRSLIVLQQQLPRDTPIEAENTKVRQMLRETAQYARDAVQTASQAAIDIRLIVGETEAYTRYFRRARPTEPTMQEIQEAIERTLEAIAHVASKSTVYKEELEAIRGQIYRNFEAVQEHTKLARVTVVSADKVLLHAKNFLRAMPQ